MEGPRILRGTVHAQLQGGARCLQLEVLVSVISD